MRPFSVKTLFAAYLLDLAAFLFPFQAFFLGCLRRPGFVTRLWSFTCLFDQFIKTRDGVFAIFLLRAESIRGDDQHPLRANSPTRELNQPRADILREGSGICHVEAQLHRSRDLVHILSARSRCADIFEVDFFIEVLHTSIICQRTHIRYAS